MKSILSNYESFRSKISQRHFVQKKMVVKWTAVLLVFAIMNLTFGCANYFKVTSSTRPASETIAAMNDNGKTIIVHFNQKKWVLTDIQVKNNTITGRINEYQMPPTFKPVKPSKPNRYLTRPSQNQRYLLNEVHLYLDEFAELGNKQVSIPVKSIIKIEVYDKDTATTVGSYFLGALGILASAYVILIIIVLIFKESCPFIYTWDGENYQFAGEIFSGSIHQPLERNDYLKLPTYPGQHTYTLKITNEVREIQHTNLLQLLVFDHPENTGILIDKYGNASTIGKAFAPTLATNFAGENVTDLVSSKDNLFYQSNSSGEELPLKDGVIMEFPSQGDAKTAKLAIHAKNSIVLDYMMGQFHDMFGSAYNGFMKKQKNASVTEMHQWSLNQGIPLSLYVERDGHWEFADYYNVAGPMKFKDDVLSVPLKGNESDPLKMKLEFGNFLWEIDYAAVDYSPDSKVKSYTIPLKNAITEEQKNVAGLLSKDDSKYYTQPITTNQAVVTFDLPEMTSQNRTIILHSKGWYEVIRNPVGKPNLENLKAFRQPGHFNQFINERMKRMGQLVSQP
ncbi:MAG: hypothetical protein WCI54_14705 [Bacteroidia bacterium]|jgi:hypothetical protein